MKKDELIAELQDLTPGLPSGEDSFFWNAIYPQRSFTRIYIVLSISIYIVGRFIEPGPDWLNKIIELLIHRFNLEFIESIPSYTYSTPTLWRGSGLALQLQILTTWPLIWIFAIWAGWLNRNGSKDFEKYPPIINKPSIKSWMLNFLLVAMILCLAYFPFQGSNATKPYIATGFYSRALGSDSYGTSMFWLLGGWVGLYLGVIMFYIIHTEFTELKATFTRNC
jgi:hypothetical protein